MRKSEGLSGRRRLFTALVGQSGRIARSIVSVGLLASVAFGNTGCIKKLLLDGQISATRKASVAVNTISDFDVAEKAAYAGIAQIEGLRYLAPDNDDALFMLTRSWASIGVGFIEDRMEEEEDAHGTSSPEYDYQKRRAIQAYERAVFYGTQLLESKHEGFKAATKNADTIRAYVAQFDDPEDAENLFWAATAWLSRINVQKENGALVGEAFVGAALLEQSAKLDDTVMYGAVHMTLGAYHARSGVAEVEQAKVEFDKALSMSGDKVLLPKVQYAVRYYCLKADKPNYEKLLNEVLKAGDGDPYQRLANTIAKRKAKRALGKERMNSNCGF